MNCYKPILITKNLDKSQFPNGLLVPCGKCLACKEELAKEYTFRFICDKQEKGYINLAFLTLTYNVENLPINHNYQMTLRKKDIILYLKAVREKLRRDMKKTNQKLLDYLYYLSGEYGEERHRPHYHVILAYNNKRVLNQFVKQWEETKGMVDCQKRARINSIFYTIGYVDKKIGLQGTGTREQLFRKFTRGMGKDWILKHAEELNKKMYCQLNKFKIGIPRYFKKKLTEMGYWTAEKETSERIHKRKSEEDKKLLELYNQKYIKKEAYTYTTTKRGREITKEQYDKIKDKLDFHHIQQKGNKIFVYVLDKTKTTIDEYKEQILKQRERNYLAKVAIRKQRLKIDYNPL